MIYQIWLLEIGIFIKLLFIFVACNFVSKSNLSQAPGSEQSSEMFAIFPGILNLLHSQFGKTFCLNVCLFVGCGVKKT